MTDPQTPSEALDAVRKSRAAVAERLTVGSLTYDLIYSGLAGGMIAAWVAPMPWPPLIMGACGLALGLLARTWAHRRGVWVSGLSPTRARWVAIGLGVVLGALSVGAVWLWRQGGQTLASWAWALRPPPSPLPLRVFG